MANWIPKITYTELGTGLAKTITFDSPPEGDPFKEDLRSVSKKNTSSNGTSQVQWSYNVRRDSLGFKYQTETTTNLFKDFLTKHAYRGGVFTYQPHSDTDDDKETYELRDKAVKFERPIPDGSGDFEYNFKFKIERVLDITYEEETVGEGAINETQFTIVNNQTSAADITGLVFDDTVVGSAQIIYWVQRKHTTPNSEVTEAGEMYVSYNSLSDDWDIKRNSVGDAGLTITITSAGQLQYESSNISGSVDTSIMRFRANTIGVAE